MIPPTLSQLSTLLLAQGARVEGQGDVVLRDVCQDSRDVLPGALFVARTGQKHAGLGFAADAVARGAVALMVDRGGAEALASNAALSHLPRLVVGDPGRSLGFAAEAVHGKPSSELRLVGITGTNGKTTTASLVGQCLEALGGRVALIGTLGLQFGDELTDVGLTTAQADVVSRFLRRSLAAGATHATMEVSSHALDQGRVDALRFEVAAFSNLTQDHLDYHGTLAAYGEAKARLFCALSPSASVINADDAFGRELLSRLPKGALSVGRDPRCDVALERCRLGAYDSQLTVNTPCGRVEFETQLVGAHNVDNWLLCIGILTALGEGVERLPEIAPRVRPAPGRMQRCVVDGTDVSVLVDYAHTPDALQRALEACRELLPPGAKLWCVFGCGGDRDRSKRPKMGKLAADLADRAVVTSDNPRTEEPKAIVEQIVAAMGGAQFEVHVQLDRAAAIAHAVQNADPSDVILIAGKGHEDYQIIGTQKLHFDDREVAEQCLRTRVAQRA